MRIEYLPRLNKKKYVLKSEFWYDSRINFPISIVGSNKCVVRKLTPIISLFFHLHVQHFTHLHNLKLINVLFDSMHWFILVSLACYKFSLFLHENPLKNCCWNLFLRNLHEFRMQSLLTLIKFQNRTITGHWGKSMNIFMYRLYL